MGFWVHACRLDSHCRAHHAPDRVYLHTPWGSVIVALMPRDWAQVWIPGHGYQPWHAPIVWHPAVR